jgi:hypothetical protein
MKKISPKEILSKIGGHDLLNVGMYFSIIIEAYNLERIFGAVS